jgi:hypothetical protein
MTRWSCAPTAVEKSLRYTRTPPSAAAEHLLFAGMAQPPSADHTSSSAQQPSLYAPMNAGVTCVGVGYACVCPACQESVLEVHQTTCARVVLSCPLGCGMDDLFRDELPEHMKHLCIRRRMRCPLECTVVRAAVVLMGKLLCRS